MKILSLWFCVVVFALGLAGCATSSSSAPMNLAGTQWKLLAVQATPALAGSTVTLHFDASGQIHGSDGCNQYRGTYVQNGAKLTLGLGMGTMMACADPQMKQAQAFAQALAATQRFRTEAGELVWEDAQGAVLARWIPLPVASLQNTPWVAQGINNGREAVVSSALTPRVTALFLPDGTVSGSAGCNRFTGRYTLEGKTLKVFPLAVTKMLCEPEVNELEQQFLAAFQQTTTIELSENRLELRNAAGALQVGFSRAK
ncbi:MAG: META domain-containing protein [Verrucomicrobia bacterium]|nr:META domain-containing protein [Verrucomicrobiota bacterium]